jgi:hypothetical protein
MQELLLFLTQSLVEDRDAVRVEELEEDGDLIYEITVDQDDLGGSSAGAAGSQTRSHARKGRSRANSAGCWSTSRLN